MTESAKTLPRGQLIDNWNHLYERETIPQWEDLEPNREYLSLLKVYISPGMRVLEVGSGLGHNALALARMGFDITASDLSENAVARCRKLAEQESVALKAMVLDVMCLPEDIEKYDLVFDKGCWHTFFAQQFRERFVEQVGTLLVDGGIWVNATGSADNGDDPNDPDLSSYPRWRLTEVVQLVEPHFEVLQVRKGRYGYKEGKDFHTWEGVFRKRVKV